MQLLMWLQLAQDGQGSRRAHGFLYNTSSKLFATLDDPSAAPNVGNVTVATGTVATGINAAGQILGYYYDSNGIAHGFFYNPNIRLARWTARMAQPLSS